MAADLGSNLKVSLFLYAGREDFATVSSKPRYFHTLNKPLGTVSGEKASHLGLPLTRVPFKALC